MTDWFSIFCCIWSEWPTKRGSWYLAACRSFQTWIWGSWPGHGAEVGKTWCKKWWKKSEKLVLLKEVWFPVARSACSFGHGGCITGTASPTRFGGQEISTDHWWIGRISRLIAMLCMMNNILDRVQMLTFIRSVTFSLGWFGTIDVRIGLTIQTKHTFEKVFCT